jgi:hypothetical protein
VHRYLRESALVFQDVTLSAEVVTKLIALDNTLVWTASGSSSLQRWRSPSRRAVRVATSLVEPSTSAALRTSSPLHLSCSTDLNPWSFTLDLLPSPPPHHQPPRHTSSMSAASPPALEPTSLLRHLRRPCHPWPWLTQFCRCNIKPNFDVVPLSSPKSLPTLLLSAFSLPDTGISDSFPLPQSPTTVHPEHVVDANVRCSIPEWREQTNGSSLEDRVGVIMVKSSETESEGFVSLPLLITNPSVDRRHRLGLQASQAGLTVLTISVPFNLEKRDDPLSPLDQVSCHPHCLFLQHIGRSGRCPPDSIERRSLHRN